MNLNPIMFILLIAVTGILFCFIPGVSVRNTATGKINANPDMILSENGGINKSRGVKVRIVFLSVYTAISLFLLILGFIIYAHDFDEFNILSLIGFLMLAFFGFFLVYNILLNRVVHSHISVFRDCISGMASYGVSYKITYDQMTSVDVIKNEKMLVIAAGGRVYKIWVAERGAIRIREVILEQKKRIDENSPVAVYESAPVSVVSQVPAAIVTCTCGRKFEEGEMFCIECGSPPPKPIACKCGDIFKENAKFCANCGSPPPESDN
jgi:hypothetical protein